MDSVLRLKNAIERRAAKVAGRTPIYYGVFVGAETVDSNLSRIRIPGVARNGGDTELRFVPRLAHVTGLTTSSTVLCIGSPLCIIGVVVGDISLASI